MFTTKRVLKVITLTLFMYVMLFMSPVQMFLTDLQAQPANNGYSPYTMYERCHPAQFDLPVSLKSQC